MLSHPEVDATRADPPGGAPRRLRWLLIGGGAVGFIAAFTLLVERLRLLEDPSYVPSCSINPILSCGSVMRTPQAEAFGFPNPVLGITGFAVVLTVGMALAAGAGFARLFWWGLQIGAAAGVVFVHWLIFQSLYRIEALCPYCIVVWIVTIPIFWYITLDNISSGRLPLSDRLRPVAHWVVSYHGVILTAWYLAIAALVGHRFWDYWSGLLS